MRSSRFCICGPGRGFLCSIGLGMVYSHEWLKLLKALMIPKPLDPS
jgi:hypothetical protein